MIEFLAEDDTAEYEDLLQRLRTSVMANGATVSEDSLLRFAEFVCDRVYHFDAAGADGEPQVGSPPPPPISVQPVGRVLTTQLPHRATDGASGARGQVLPKTNKQKWGPGRVQLDDLELVCFS